MPPSSLPKLEITLPRSWEELTQEQLAYVLEMMAAGFTAEDLKCYAVLRFAGLLPILPDGLTPILEYQGRPVRVNRDEIALAAAALDWLDTYPNFPVRLEKIGKAQAVDALLYGVAFADFLALENLYQGFLFSKEKKALEEIAETLYPGLAALDAQRHCTHVAVLLWWAGLKQTLATMYPDLFAPAECAGQQQTPAKVMNAMIRALTGGDVVKEEKVLAIETHRALIELNEKAREAREFNELNNR